MRQALARPAVGRASAKSRHDVDAAFGQDIEDLVEQIDGLAIRCQVPGEALALRSQRPCVRQNHVRADEKRRGGGLRRWA